MAKQTTILKYSGRLGEKIGYKRNGKYYERSMPQSVRQTSATRRAAHRFGRASRTGAIIRKALSTEMEVKCDSTHINQLTKALLPNDLQNLKGFRFNQYTGTERFFTAAPKLSRTGTLHIPPQTLPTIKGITTLEIKVIGIRIDCATQQVTGKDVAFITIPAGAAFAGAALPLNVPGIGTLLVTLQVKGMYKDGPSANKQHLAADLIEVQETKIKELRIKESGIKESRTKQLVNKPAYPPQRTRLQRPTMLLTTYTHPLLPVIQRE